MAEISSAMICARLGVQPAFAQNAAYLKSWIAVLKADHRAIIKAASMAQAAADWMFETAGEPDWPLEPEAGQDRNGNRADQTLGVGCFLNSQNGEQTMYTGTLTKIDADDAFTGEIASLDFDLTFTMVPNAFKAKDNHPDYVIEARSPGGRSLRIGSGWASKSRAGNDYFSLAFNLSGQSVVRVNAVIDDDAAPGVYRIIPMITAVAA